MITKQEIFDRVVTGLRKQGCKSAKNNGKGIISCLYRGPNNTKCAAGQVILDSAYDDSFEGKPINDLIDIHGDEYLFGDKIEIESIILLVRLQISHDKCKPEYWENEWQCLANEYGLTMPEGTPLRRLSDDN